jgi:hypothetical protein
MHVVALERVVADAELAALTALAERPFELANECPSSKRRYIPAGPERDVRRTAPGMRVAPDVVDDAMQLAGSPSAASGSTTTGSTAVVVEGELSGSAHHQ